MICHERGQARGLEVDEGGLAEGEEFPPRSGDDPGH